MYITFSLLHYLLVYNNKVYCIKKNSPAALQLAAAAVPGGGQPAPGGEPSCEQVSVMSVFEETYHRYESPDDDLVEMHVVVMITTTTTKKFKSGRKPGETIYLDWSGSLPCISDTLFWTWPRSPLL